MTTLYSLWDTVKLPDFTGRCGQVGVTTAGVVTNGKFFLCVIFVNFNFCRAKLNSMVYTGARGAYRDKWKTVGKCKR